MVHNKHHTPPAPPSSTSIASATTSTPSFYSASRSPCPQKLARINGLSINDHLHAPRTLAEWHNLHSVLTTITTVRNQISGRMPLGPSGEPKLAPPIARAASKPWAALPLAGVLRALAGARRLPAAKAAHCHLITTGVLPDLQTSNHLISMYANLGLMDHAHRLFDQMPHRNTVSWTALISGYSNSGSAAAALTSFRSMVAAGVPPNGFTYVAALSACTAVRAANPGREIQARIYRLKHNGVSGGFVSNSLVNLYAKCGMMAAAQKVFDMILLPSSVSWSSLLSGYCRSGENEEAVRVFLRARKAGAEVNEFLIAGVLSACAGMRDRAVGMQVHCHVVKSGSGLDRFVEAGVIDMYINCGDLECARRAFLEVDNPGLASWAALVGGYSQHGQGEKAMGLFRKMHSSGYVPNEHIIPSVLVACSATAAIEGGKQLHSLVIKLGFRMVAHIGNSVVDFYAKNGLLGDLSRAFEEMEERDVVSWNAVISGHIEHSDLGGATELLKLMLLEGIAPNAYTYSIVLSLCADLPALGWGQQIHNRMVKPGFNDNVVVGSALIDMYAKCGRLSDAHRVFDRLPAKNLVSWNSLLVGYAQHGFGREALEIFTMMQKEGIRPNDVTFIGVLSACVHMGLVEEGKCYFDLMRKYGIIPRIDHYACLVDLLARAGQTQVAYEFVKGMPLEPNKVIWRSLLAGCKKHGDLHVGKLAAEHILEMDSEDVSARVMLSGSYASADLWDEIAEVRRLPKGFEKITGCSWVQIKNKNHCFIAGDAGQDQEAGVHDLLNGLVVQMINAGYSPKCDYM